MKGVREIIPKCNPAARWTRISTHVCYKAQIAVGNRVFYLGSYADEFAASRAYDFAVFYLRAYRKKEEYNDSAFAAFLRTVAPPGPEVKFDRESDKALIKCKREAFALIPLEPLGESECAYCGSATCRTLLEHRLRLIKNELDQYKS